MPENLHKLFVISSPSGGGKTSLINKLFEDTRSMNFKKSISDTTRQKREGDINGRDYYFLSEKEFKDKLYSAFIKKVEDIEITLPNDPRVIKLKQTIDEEYRKL